jgi:hypothetical protein
MPLPGPRRMIARMLVALLVFQPDEADPDTASQ